MATGDRLQILANQCRLFEFGLAARQAERAPDAPGIASCTVDGRIAHRTF